jgi:hypothetical protein
MAAGVTNRVETKWQHVLERLRRGMCDHDLKPLPPEVERSLEHAFVRGMVAHRALLYSALDADETTDALEALDSDLRAAADRLAISLDDTH